MKHTSHQELFAQIHVYTCNMGYQRVMLLLGFEFEGIVVCKEMLAHMLTAVPFLITKQ